jgi:hypothetical protein
MTVRLCQAPYFDLALQPQPIPVRRQPQKHSNRDQEHSGLGKALELYEKGWAERVPIPSVAGAAQSDAGILLVQIALVTPDEEETIGHC